MRINHLATLPRREKSKENILAKCGAKKVEKTSSELRMQIREIR
jgi:hypothetical protein